MKRLRIDRIDLDMRGIPSATAESAARQLRTALQRAMAQRTVTAASVPSLQTGGVTFDHTPDAPALAERVARHIANATSNDNRASGDGRKR